jgi:hypothetical protein
VLTGRRTQDTDLGLESQEPYSPFFRTTTRFNCASIANQTEQTDFDDRTDRDLKDDRARAGATDRGHSHDSVHEIDPFGSILSLV